MVSIPAFPGLLRPGSTVEFAKSIRHFYGGKDGGIVFAVGNEKAIVTFLEDCRPLPIPLGELSLVLDDNGRLHARLWLAEQGHVTTEDRAEVLAWSVESVRRGGGIIRLVLGYWWQQDATWRRDGFRGSDKVTAAVGATNTCGVEWEILTWFPNSTSRDAGHYGRDFASIEAAKAACDAAALASRWALTNDDGSLTLPPLPEVPDVAR